MIYAEFIKSFNIPRMKLGGNERSEVFMKKRSGIVILSLTLCSLLSLNGCQKTPEKSAVVSKAGGLSEDVIAEPLTDGETRVVELPGHWKHSELRSNDRVTLSVDFPMKSMEVGNLPIIEMKNHVMTQEELENLVEYFAGDEELYVPEATTKADYQEIKDRMENGEGFYGHNSLYYKNMLKYLDNAIEVAPSEQPEKEKVEVKFQKRPVDKAFYESQKYFYDATSRDISELDAVMANYDYDCYLYADVGDERKAAIKAAQYNADIGNVSRFSWETGAMVITEEDYIHTKNLNTGQIAYNATIDYYKQIDETLKQFEAALNEEPITLDAGQKQAEKVLKDLGIQDMSVLSTQKAVWFPKGAYTEKLYSNFEDDLQYADMGQAKTGYIYTFSRTVGGLPVGQFDRSFMQNAIEGSYIPPFDTEAVDILVTEDGIQSFSWEGMCEEVDTVAENTNLLPFEDIQEKAIDQMYYNYASMGQPSESRTKFIYRLIDAWLGYTYVPAYGKPENAWLVPTWFFKEDTHVDDTAEMGVEYDEEKAYEFMLNATDGGMIGATYSK